MDSQLHYGSGGAAWCSSEAVDDLDPSHMASSWSWQESQLSFLSRPHPHPHPHLHLSHRTSSRRCFLPPAGTPAEIVRIKQYAGEIKAKHKSSGKLE